VESNGHTEGLYQPRRQPDIPFLFVDIETKALKNASFYLPEVSAPANYKDPEKIAAYIAEKQEGLLEKAALDVDLGSIVAIGYQRGLAGAAWASVVGDQKPDGSLVTEEELLREFWAEARQAEGLLCGYNLLAFDFPFILRRTMALGVTPTVVLDTRRYQVAPIRDLMAILFNWGSMTYRGMKWVAQRYDLEVLRPDLDGSKVKDMDVATIIEYALSDIHVLAQLYKLMDGIYWVRGR